MWLWRVREGAGWQLVHIRLGCTWAWEYRVMNVHIYIWVSMSQSFPTKGSCKQGFKYFYQINLMNLQQKSVEHHCFIFSTHPKSIVHGRYEEKNNKCLASSWINYISSVIFLFIPAFWQVADLRDGGRSSCWVARQKACAYTVQTVHQPVMVSPTPGPACIMSRTG